MPSSRVPTPTALAMILAVAVAAVVVALSLAGTGAQALYDGKTDVVALTPSNWKETQSGVWLVEFYAPWCGHCKAAAGDFAKAATALKGIAKLGAVDMTVHQSLGAPFNVQGFPTFKVFADGKASDYNGQRTAPAFVDAVTSQIARTAKARLSPGGGSSQSQSQSQSQQQQQRGGANKKPTPGTIEDATDDNFDTVVLGNPNDLVMVAFVASWCGHCKNLKPHYEEAARKAPPGIRFVYVEGPNNNNLMSRFGVRGFPTIKAFPPGRKSDSTAVDYNGERETEPILSFATALFEKHGGKAEMDVPEITDQATFDQTCAANKKCILVFVPDLLDSGAKGRNAALDVVKQAAGKVRHIPHAWVSANSQPKFEEAYALQSGFPAILMLREVDGQKVGFVHRGKFTVDDLVAFATTPRAVGAATKGGWPAIQKTTPWDGKDAPKPVTEEKDDFDLDAFLNS